MPKSADFRVLRAVTRVTQLWQPLGASSSSVAGTFWLEAEHLAAGSGCRARQLRFFAQRQHGPHVWLKTDREKWHKDLTLDSVWELEREVLYVTALKDILANQPEMKMSLRELRDYKRHIGLYGTNVRPVTWLEKYPTLFDVGAADSHNCVYFVLRSLGYIVLFTDEYPCLFRWIRTCLFWSICRVLLVRFFDSPSAPQSMLRRRSSSGMTMRGCSLIK